MAANKANYIVVWKHDPQVYAASKKETALNSLPPGGKDWPIDHKRVFFITYRPDEEILSVHEVDHEEIVNATASSGGDV